MSKVARVGLWLGAARATGAGAAGARRAGPSSCLKRATNAELGQLFTDGRTRIRLRGGTSWALIALATPEVLLHLTD
jgi:hypothetical protein